MRSVPRSIAQPAETTDVNVRGTLNVLLAARDMPANVAPPFPLRRKQIGR
jgi:nucleoside-diphosphate-sugar epimerase